MEESVKSLDWIDSFVSEIKPYIFVRLTDKVLIRMPNQAFKLNKTGAKVLAHIMSGGSIRDILKARKNDADLPGQLESFFRDLARVLGSKLCDTYQSSSLKRTPFTLGYIELPVLSEVALTFKCNIKCKFCYASCRCISKPDRGIEDNFHEMSTPQIRKILQMIRKDAEVPSVSFTGGEPVLHPDLAELISYASKQLGMRVNLISNGTLIDDPMARKLKSAGLASAQISIESPDGAIHDDIVGVPGAFQASVNGLKSLKNTGIPVHPHATICSLNKNSLKGMPGLAKFLGIDRFSANLIIPSGRGENSEISVPYSDVEGILNTIMDASVAENIRFMWYSPTPLCLFNPVAHFMGNKGCSACEGLLSVDPFGRILPCSSWNEPLGNMLEEGFKSIWFGERSKYLRDKREAHEICRDCDQFSVCHGACPLYFNIHGYDELKPMFEKIHS